MKGISEKFKRNPSTVASRSSYTIFNFVRNEILFLHLKILNIRKDKVSLWIYKRWWLVIIISKNKKKTVLY